MSTSTNNKPLKAFISMRDDFADPYAENIVRRARRFLQLETGRIRVVKVFLVFEPLTHEEAAFFAGLGLRDAILHEVSFDKPIIPAEFRSWILVSRKPGVTDDEGISAQFVMRDLLGKELPNTQRIFTQSLYFVENHLEHSDLIKIASGLLGNPLINNFNAGHTTDNGISEQDQRAFELITHCVNRSLSSDESTMPVDPEYISLDIDDCEMINLSKSRVLSLNLEEMKAIKSHFSGLKNDARRISLGLRLEPTDCELEIIAQTWSEHCKHKEFSAFIEYYDLDSGEKSTVDSLFATYIKGATQKIMDMHAENGSEWLIKVFSDNAGVVRIDSDRNFVWKVETHNSPSALDPYGGALTGIVGNNRDPMGTGRGGARLLFNTNVLCFASPDFSGTLYPGQLHPRAILEGVRRGIEDGGNKSGIPTINGSVVFDDDYRAKPLVFCGTGGVMNSSYNGKPSWEKVIETGDLILTAGGRVGKDGIHGATFSSSEMDENSPPTAVQIGSPITQKMLSDFLEIACKNGFVKCCTDNGAGGLSSSIGELATISGGALVCLDNVPLKYHGLKAWEIFLSESQERMTLVVEKKKLAELMDLAHKMEVEVAHIGSFNSTGFLDVYYRKRCIASLAMHFLHNGVPRKYLQAEWKKPSVEPFTEPDPVDYEKLLIDLLRSENICSRENFIRVYDHEVKGRSVIKPLMGPYGNAPQDAAVIGFDFGDFSGVAVSNGIIPRYGRIDPFQMSAGAFDEAVRQIVSVGGCIPDRELNPDGFWSVNDNFCLPDSVYDLELNPDGKTKLGSLVLMCRALYEMSVFYGIPMTSGKDSMKNDFRWGDCKISVPPTVLYSMAAKISDVRKIVTTEFKLSGDLVYIVGETFHELGGSEVMRLLNKSSTDVPIVRKEQARNRYLKMSKANSLGLIASCHDISDGGFAIALAESAFGSGLGVDVTLNDAAVPLISLLFAESHSRFVVSIDPVHQKSFEMIFNDDARYIGRVTEDPRFRIRHCQSCIIDLPVSVILNAWRRKPLDTSVPAHLEIHPVPVERIEKPAGEEKVKAIVVYGFGINCEEETAQAFRLAGADADIVHLNDIFAGTSNIRNYDILALPGGFSFGDDLGSGKVLADKLRFKKTIDGRLFFDLLKDFIAESKFVLGICNGFQSLVKAGFLPNIGGAFEQEATLTFNNSGRFEDRWVRLRANPKTPLSSFLKGISGMELPVRHGEGRLVLRDENIRALVKEQGLDCFWYVDSDDNPTANYPANPNGSDLNAAALTDSSGRVLGIMPHPEAFLYDFLHPDHGRRSRFRKTCDQPGDGLAIFNSIVNHIADLKNKPSTRSSGGKLK